MNNHPFTEPWDKHIPSIRKEQYKQVPHTGRDLSALTIEDLFPRIGKWAIGYNPVFEQFKQLANEKPSYPPYDIIADEEGLETMLTIAVAGFSKEELSITVHDSTLTVSGKKAEKEDMSDVRVVHKGIASRDFKLNFALAEFYEVDGSELRDGMLYISIYKDVPEEKKPKTITID